ncbi:MAG: hypothetical protein AB7F22_33205 [Reyranella sp.]
MFEFVDSLRVELADRGVSVMIAARSGRTESRSAPVRCRRRRS